MGYKFYSVLSVLFLSAVGTFGSDSELSITEIQVVEESPASSENMTNDSMYIDSLKKSVKGVLTSFGGGMSIRGAVGSEVNALEEGLEGASTTALGGNFSFRLGYRFNRVVSAYSGIDITSKGYRIRLETQGQYAAFLQRGGAALEIPLLFRPILPTSSSRSFLVYGGIAPSFLLTDNMKVYADKNSLMVSSEREEFESADMKEAITIYNSDSTDSRTFDYNDVNRVFDLSLILGIGFERYVAKNASMFFSVTYRHGLVNAKKLTDEALQKFNELGYWAENGEQYFRTVDFTVGINIYSKKE